MRSGDRRARVVLTALAWAGLGVGGGPASRPGDAEEASNRRDPVVLNDDGGWCWFQDERALLLGQWLIFGSVAGGSWKTLLSWLNGVQFGREDPAFNRDIAFYMFDLPAFQLIQGWFLGLMIVSTIAAGAVYALSLSLQGFELNGDVNGADYDERRFDIVWEAAEELEMTAILHPMGFTHGQRMDDYYLVNVICMPLASTVAVSRMCRARNRASSATNTSRPKGIRQVN